MDLDNLITKKLRAEHEAERALHEPSGKLSAGQLSKPLLEQILKIIGVPEKPVDDYTLRLFKRGKQVEQWVIDMIGDESTQVEVDYKGVIGFVDKVLNDEPYEIKSVKGSQWKWLQKQGARQGHKLQGGLYGLALESDKYHVVYVCADDFRIMPFELLTADIKPAIEKIMLEVKSVLKGGSLPEFKPREDWHATPDYATKYTFYPEWLSLTPELMMEKLKNQFPDSYKRLKTLSKGVK